MSSRDVPPAAAGPDTHEVQDWADLLAEIWTFLTERRAVVDYNFVNMTIEVPRDTGANAPRAIWKMDGTLRVTTADRTTPDGEQSAGEPLRDRERGRE